MDEQGEFFPKQPLPIDHDQWPEGRGFARIYGRDPHRQQPIMKNLLGYRAMLRMEQDLTTLQALDIVIAHWARRFPEHLRPMKAEEQDSDIDRRDYIPDKRMLSLLGRVVDID